MDKKNLNLEEIVDFSIDYYAVLGLKSGDLPEGKNREEKQQIAYILQCARREMSKTTHPDFGGSPEAFKLLIRAEWILSDPIGRKYYESKGAWKPSFTGAGTDFDVDWDSIGTYRKNSQADIIGYDLFHRVTGNEGERAKILGLVPAFRPQLESDNNEWDWVIKTTERKEKIDKLALSIVHDESEVLRLTTGEQAITDSLPFKIYICIPRAKIHYLRDPDIEVEEDGVKDIIKGRIRSVIYSDYDLLSTTSLKEAEHYIEGGLEKDIIDFRNGTLMAKQTQIDAVAKAARSMSSEEMIQRDTEILKAIMRQRLEFFNKDVKAADFLENLPEDE